MKLNYAIFALLVLGVAACSDNQQIAEPVEEEVEQDAGDQQEDDDVEFSDEENAGISAENEDYANEDLEEATPSDSMAGEDASAAPMPMKEDEKGGGGIISGGVKPQPSGEMTIDCEETTMAAPKGYVMYGCKAMVGGQKAPAIRGQWRPFDSKGNRIRMRDVAFNQGAYDVVFAVREVDAAAGFTMKRK